MEMLQHITEAVQENLSVARENLSATRENLSATRNASRIGSTDWDRVLVALDLRLVPTSGDPLQRTLISSQAVAFW